MYIITQLVNFCTRGYISNSSLLSQINSSLFGWIPYLVSEWVKNKKNKNHQGRQTYSWTIEEYGPRAKYMAFVCKTNSIVIKVFPFCFVLFCFTLRSVLFFLMAPRLECNSKKKKSRKLFMRFFFVIYFKVCVTSIFL